MELPVNLLDCGGRAKRRHRFRAHRARRILFPAPACESGVALRFPPQSKICLVTHDERYARDAQRTVRLFDGQIVSEEVAAAAR